MKISLYCLLQVFVLSAIPFFGICAERSLPESSKRESRITHPVQDQIPIKSFLIPDAYVRIDSVDPKRLIRYELTMNMPHWLQYGCNGGFVTVIHEAALSSATVDSYVEDVVKQFKECSEKLRAFFGGFTGCSEIRKQIEKDTAYIEIDEIVLANARNHAFLKIMRTPEGFALISAFALSREWSVVGGELKKCVYNVRLMSSRENALFSGKQFVCVDVDGDVFVPVESILDHEKLKFSSERNYFLNQGKNDLDKIAEGKAIEEQKRMQDALMAEEQKNRPSSWVIQSLFGFEVGSFLQDVSRARKIGDRGFVLQTELSAKRPYDVFSKVKLYYTKEDAMLYRVQLLSTLKVRPDKKKMRDRLEEISDSVGAKFKDILVMRKKGNLNVAEFVKNYGQSLKLSLVPDSVDRGQGLTEATGLRFELDFCDNELYENGLHSVRFKK